ncbi:hypothetical protein JCM3765_007244 [Sporobolomyces pararoseus]
MRLTLKPPPDLLVPSTFHSHYLPSPKLPSVKTLKVPQPYIRAKKRLNDVGLANPHYLTADKALWWQFVIEQVEWDLELEQVVVKLMDGTEERWDLGGIKSSELLSDDEEEDEESREEEKGEGKRRKEQTSPSSSFKTRWSPQVILDQLRSFSIQLRSAYEDITTSSIIDNHSPHLDTEKDFKILMSLSANPSLPVPLEWVQDKSAYSYFMDEDLIDGFEDEGLNERGELEEQPRQGQFKSRRRPNRLHVPYENAPTPTTPSSITKNRSTSQPPHDYLSLVELLTQIRTYLFDLLPSTIFPQLKEICGPNYILWATEGAISWCRSQAIEKGREVGIIILELLEDEPEAVLESSTLLSDIEDEGGGGGDSSNYAEDSEEEEESWGIEIRESEGRKNKNSVWNDLIKLDKKRNDNPLDSMREDFDLRCWAEDAIERSRAVERQQWLKKKQSKPKWLNEPEPWEVSIPLDVDQDEYDEDDSSDFDEPFPVKNSRKVSAPFSMPRSLTNHLSKSLPPQPLTSPPRQEDILVPALSPSTSSSSSSSSGDYEPLSNPPSQPDSTTYSDFFYIQDYLEEEFLPKKLPRAVVTPSNTRGRQMEKARALLHAKLNEIAGLERKILELQEFSAEEQGSYDDELETQRQIKDKHSQTSSGLRQPGASSFSPPPTPRRKNVLPLKAQPLRHQTADNLLTARLAQAMEGLEPKASTRKQTYKEINRKISPNNNKRKILATPKPRKRQKFNLETLDKVNALEMKIRRDMRGVGNDRLTRSSQASALALSDKGAKRNRVEVGGPNGSTKKLRKGKPLRREDSEVNLDPFLLQSPSTVPASSSTPSASRLSLLELARRRPPPIIVDQPILPDSLETDELMLEPTSLPTEVSSFSSPRTLTELEMAKAEEEELTDTEAEEIEIEKDHFVLDFDSDDESEEMEAIEIPSPFLKSNSSPQVSPYFIPSSQLPASPPSPSPPNDSSVFNFPLSNARKDASYTSDRAPMTPSNSSLWRVHPRLPATSPPSSPIRPSLGPRRSAFSVPSTSSPEVSPYFSGLNQLDEAPSPTRSIGGMTGRMLESLSLISGTKERTGAGFSSDEVVSEQAEGVRELTIDQKRE